MLRNIFLKLNSVCSFRGVGVHSGGVHSGGYEKSIVFGANHWPSVHSGAVPSGEGVSVFLQKKPLANCIINNKSCENFIAFNAKIRRRFFNERSKKFDRDYVDFQNLT